MHVCMRDNEERMVERDRERRFIQKDSGVIQKEKG